MNHDQFSSSSSLYLPATGTSRSLPINHGSVSSIEDVQSDESIDNYFNNSTNDISSFNDERNEILLSKTTSISSSEKKKFKRRKHKKSRVGCPQCKKRKIKCDETLPSCQKCASKDIRCGYLDYTPRELDMVKLAHWEAHGADPLKFPLNKKSYEIVAQQFDVSNTPNDERPSWSHSSSYYANHSHSNNDQYSDDNNNDLSSDHFEAFTDQPSPNFNVRGRTYYTSFILPPKYIFFDPPGHKRITSLDKYLSNDFDGESPGYSVHSPANFNSPDSSMEPFLAGLNHGGEFDYYLDEVSNNILLSSESGNFSMKLIKHEDNCPVVQMDQYPSFLNESISSFMFRVYVRRLAFTSLVYSRFYMPMFIATLLYGGNGTLLRDHPELKQNTLEMRGICMNFILKESKNIDDDNVVPLLRTATVLNCNSLYLNDNDVNYKDYLRYSAGPGSILTKIYENPQNFPKSLPAIKLFGDFLLFSAKYIFIPQYDHKVLYEFFDVVKEFGLKYLSGKKKLKISSKDASHLRKQHKDLLGFIEFCLNVLEDKNYTSSQKGNSWLRYPVEKLFELMRKWYAIVPSEMFTMGSKTPNIRKIFNVFWYALLRILEACFSNCRYIFSFFLDGFYLSYGFKKEQLLSGLRDKQLIWYLNYSCRIISFFDRRMCYIISTAKFNSSVPSFLEGKFQLEAAPLDIAEKYITSFKNTVIKKIHYPKEVPKSLISQTTSDNLENPDSMDHDLGSSYNDQQLDKTFPNLFNMSENYFNNNIRSLHNQSLTATDTGFATVNDNQSNTSGFYTNDNHQLNNSGFEVDLGLFEYLDDIGTNTDIDGEEKVDLVNNVNPRTSLLNNDYDPRYINADYNRIIICHDASRDFFHEYVKDRHLISELENLNL